MREYFRRKLEMWRQDILDETDATLEKLRLDTSQKLDLGDCAAVESERLVQLRTRDRARKLISKIEAALQRIEDGSYGYCEETAEPISIRRLEARSSRRSVSRRRSATSATNAPTATVDLCFKPVVDAGWGRENTP